MSTNTILGVAAFACGIVSMAAPQVSRWVIGGWLILYGAVTLFH